MMRGVSYAVRGFVITFAPVAVAVVGFSTRAFHPAIGYGLLVVAGFWMVAVVAVRGHRASSR